MLPAITFATARSQQCNETLVQHQDRRSIVNTVAVDCSAWLERWFDELRGDASGMKWLELLDSMAKRLIADCTSATVLPVRLALCFDAPTFDTDDYVSDPDRTRLLGAALLASEVPPGRPLKQWLADPEWHMAFNVSLFDRLVRTTWLSPNFATTVFLDGLLPMERRVAVCMMQQQQATPLSSATIAPPPPPRRIVCDASRAAVTGVALLQWPARTRFAVDRLAMWASIASGTTVVYSSNWMSLAKLMTLQELALLEEKNGSVVPPTVKVLHSHCVPSQCTGDLLDVHDMTLQTRLAHVSALEGLTTYSDTHTVMVMPVLSLLMHEFADYPLGTLVTLTSSIASTFCADLVAIQVQSATQPCSTALSVDQYMRLCIFIEQNLSLQTDRKALVRRHTAAAAMLDRLYNAHL